MVKDLCGKSHTWVYISGPSGKYQAHVGRGRFAVQSTRL